MTTIIAFLAGFYLGTIVFSLLVMARRSAGNQHLAKLSIINHFRMPGLTTRSHGVRRSVNHGLRDVENIL